MPSFLTLFGQSGMFSRVRVRPCGARLNWRHPASRPSFQRNFSEGQSQSQSQSQSQTPFQWSKHPVRIVGPTVWSVTAISTIYFTCAAFDVYQDARKYGKGRRRTLAFDEIQSARALEQVRAIYARSSQHHSGPIPVSSPLALWNGLGGPEKVIASIVGINTLTLLLRYVPSRATQRFVCGLAHTPVQGAFRYRQLLTSAFTHTGPIHLAMNTWALINFAPSLAQTPEFKGSGSHTLAFYISGGVVSALGTHIATSFWPNKMSRFSPVLGVSGVVSAIFAAWCMEHPDSRVQLFLMPSWIFTALSTLKGLMMLEALGVLGLFNFLTPKIAHSSHLSGLLFGAAYVTYGKGERCWTPFRRAAFRSLKSVGVI